MIELSLSPDAADRIERALDAHAEAQRREARGRRSAGPALAGYRSHLREDADEARRISLRLGALRSEHA